MVGNIFYDHILPPLFLKQLCYSFSDTFHILLFPSILPLNAVLITLHDWFRPSNPSQSFLWFVFQAQIQMPDGNTSNSTGLNYTYACSLIIPISFNHTSLAGITQWLSVKPMNQEDDG